MHGSPGPERLVRYRWAGRVIDDGRVLDAGCGTGWGTASLARVATQAVGVDYSPPAILEARERHGRVAEFHDGDLRSLPFENGAFDGVVCFETLGHVAEVDKVLDELRRVLLPGGRLVISAPNRDAYPEGNPLHARELSSSELEHELARRFANVVVLRQQSYVASMICDGKTLAQDDAALPVDADVIKSQGGPPGSELYAIAVATDGAMPDAPSCVALGHSVDAAEQRRQLETWQARAVEAEAELLAVRRELRHLRK